MTRHWTQVDDNAPLIPVLPPAIDGWNSPKPEPIGVGARALLGQSVDPELVRHRHSQPVLMNTPVPLPDEALEEIEREQLLSQVAY